MFLSILLKSTDLYRHKILDTKINLSLTSCAIFQSNFSDNNLSNNGVGSQKDAYFSVFVFQIFLYGNKTDMNLMEENPGINSTPV